jgi:hypothetical protein
VDPHGGQENVLPEAEDNVEEEVRVYIYIYIYI